MLKLERKCFKTCYLQRCCMLQDLSVPLFLRCVRLVSPNLENSEDSSPHRDGNSFQTQKSFETTASRFTEVKRKFSNENENLSEICTATCLLEHKALKAFQTHKRYRFENFVVNETRILYLPSLPFSEFVSIENTLKFKTPEFMTFPWLS